MRLTLSRAPARARTLTTMSTALRGLPSDTELAGGLYTVGEKKGEPAKRSRHRSSRPHVVVASGGPTARSTPRNSTKKHFPATPMSVWSVSREGQ